MQDNKVAAPEASDAPEAVGNDPSVGDAPAEEARIQSRLERRKLLIASENVNHRAWSILQQGERPPAPQVETHLKLGFIGGNELAEGLSRFAEVSRLDAEGGTNSGTPFSKLDLVLVELTFDYGDQMPWRRLILNAGNDGTALKKLRQRCARSRIPLVAWHTLDGKSVRTFAGAASQADVVCFADRQALRCASSSFSKPAAHLPIAFDPVVFNPWKSREIMRLAPAMPCLLDAGMRDLMFADPDREFVKLIDPLLQRRFWIYDTDVRLRPQPTYAPMHMLRRNLGSLDRRARAGALSLARFAAELSTPTGSDAILKSRHTLEALAAGCVPLINFGLADSGLEDLGEYVLPLDSDLDAYLSQLRERYWNFETLSHLGYRAVFTRHTHAHRFERLLDHLEAHQRAPARAAAIKSALCRQPRVSAIVPTMRPWLAPFVYRLFAAQVHPDRELVFAFHHAEFDFAETFPEIAADERVKHVFVHPRYHIGTCINVAIEMASGQFWAKMDDDDYYGPHYLSDYLLARSYTDFDIAGKSHHFIYDEAQDTIFSRHHPRVAHSDNVTYCGGTFFVKNSPERRFLFPEDVKGMADIQFTWSHYESGARMLSTDPYNFLQVRRSDKSGHTWRIDTDDLVISTAFCAGPQIDRIAI